MPTPEHLERDRDYQTARETKAADKEKKLKRLGKMLEEGLTEKVIAERLEVSTRQVRKWKRELREGGSNGSAPSA